MSIAARNLIQKKSSNSLKNTLNLKK